MEVIVCSGYTHRAGLLDEYEQQLADAGIPLHLEQLGSLPCGANSINMQRRIQFIRNLCMKFSGAFDKIVITDAWDVLFFGTRDELINKVPDTLLVSAERNCYPEAEYGDKITGTTPWRYVNNGMMAGSPDYLRAWCDQAERTPNLDLLDQAWFNRRRSEGSDLVPLDDTTDLFYVVSATRENGELKMKNGRPWNSLCDTYPCLFHFSGQCDPLAFRYLISGQRDRL